MTSKDPFDNEFGNSLRDSILDKRIKKLQVRVEQLEFDAETIERINQKLDEIERILDKKIQIVDVEGPDDDATLIFLTKDINPIEGV